MVFALQLAKMGALAAVSALIAVHWFTPLDAGLLGVAVFYALLVRVS